MPNSAKPPCLGRVLLDLGGGWKVRVMRLSTDGPIRPDAALVSPNGRHAWVRYTRLPAWWLLSQAQ